VVNESLERVNLKEAAEKKINDCSKGMRQRLGLAQTLIGSPSLLLLDEPSNGLDPEGQAEICRQIQSLHSQGKTILLSSHQLPEVTQVCTSVIILYEGKIHYQNQMQGVLAERPFATIRVDKEITDLTPILLGLHPDIEINDKEIILTPTAGPSVSQAGRCRGSRWPMPPGLLPTAASSCWASTCRWRAT
jgi:ABC-2 type transport system ATP-binding protein